MASDDMTFGPNQHIPLIPRRPFDRKTEEHDSFVINVANDVAHSDMEDLPYILGFRSDNHVWLRIIEQDQVYEKRMRSVAHLDYASKDDTPTECKKYCQELLTGHRYDNLTARDISTLVRDQDADFEDKLGLNES